MGHHLFITVRLERFFQVVVGSSWPCKCRFAENQRSRKEGLAGWGWLWCHHRRSLPTGSWRGVVYEEKGKQHKGNWKSKCKLPSVLSCIQEKLHRHIHDSRVNFSLSYLFVGKESPGGLRVLNTTRLDLWAEDISLLSEMDRMCDLPKITLDTSLKQGAEHLAVHAGSGKWRSRNNFYPVISVSSHGRLGCAHCTCSCALRWARWVHLLPEDSAQKCWAAWPWNTAQYPMPVL